MRNFARNIFSLKRISFKGAVLRITAIVRADLDVYADMESQFCNGGMGYGWVVIGRVGKPH